MEGRSPVESKLQNQWKIAAKDLFRNKDYKMAKDALKIVKLEVTEQIFNFLKGNEPAIATQIAFALANLKQAKVELKPFIVDAIGKDKFPLFIAGEIIKLYANEEEIPEDEIIRDMIACRFEKEKMSEILDLQKAGILNYTYQFYKNHRDQVLQDILVEGVPGKASNLATTLKLFLIPSALDEFMAFCDENRHSITYKKFSQIIFGVCCLQDVNNNILTKENALLVLQYYVTNDFKDVESKDVGDGLTKILSNLNLHALLNDYTRKIFVKLTLDDGKELSTLLIKWQELKLIDDDFLKLLEESIKVDKIKDILNSLHSINLSQCFSPRDLSIQLLTQNIHHNSKLLLEQLQNQESSKSDKSEQTTVLRKSIDFKSTKTALQQETIYKNNKQKNKIDSYSEKPRYKCNVM